MKNNWQTKTLGDVCEVFDDGDWIEKKDQSTEGIRLIQTGNVGNGIFKNREGKSRFISEKTFNRLRCTEIVPTDCLISRLPDPVGRSCIIPETGEKMITAVDCTIVRFKNDEVLPWWFIYYSLSNEYQSQINKQLRGTTRQRISRSNLGIIEIPLPKPNEQRRIVAILDDVFERVAKAKANAEKNLLNAKEVFESYLQKVFAEPGEDWVEMKLKDIGRTQTGLTPPTSEKKYYGGTIPFIKPADVDPEGDGTIRYDNESLSKAGLQAGRKIDENSVLMVCIGATITKTGFADREVSCNQQINTLTPNSKYEPKLFYYILRTDRFKKTVIKESSQATLPIINKGKWESLIISFPSTRAEQRTIVSNLDALSSETKQLEAIYRQKLSSLEELKKSVLCSAFRGEL